LETPDVVTYGIRGCWRNEAGEGSITQRRGDAEGEMPAGGRFGRQGGIYLGRVFKIAQWGNRLAGANDGKG